MPSKEITLIGTKVKVVDRMLVVLSVDPAAKAGASVFLDGVLKGYKEFNGASFWTAYEALGDLLKGMPEDAEYLCLTEEGFVGAPGAGSLTLGRRRGLIQAAAEALGIQQIMFISPSSWQPKILGFVPKGQTKIASQAYVHAKYDISPGPDVSDSICIHDYFTKHLHNLSVGCKLYTRGVLDVRYKSAPRKVSTAMSGSPKLSISRGKRRPKSRRSADPAGQG
jgi:hypothetical protein